MGGPLEQAGAVREPSEYATLSMDRAITGLWTQRSPLRDADVPYLYGKFYSASRFDSLIDGINRELTAKLTNARRAGSSVWNANTFPAIDSFYSFKYIQNSSEVVRTIVDGRDGNIYDATGGGKTTLFTTAAGAAKTRFLGVGTQLFFGDGIDLERIQRSPITWAALTTFTNGQFIVDTNLNLQLNIGSQTATVTNIQITSNVVTLIFNALTPLSIPIGTKLTLSGLTTVAALSGTTQTVTAVPNGQQVQFSYTHADVAYSVETGSATTGNGTTGASQPSWSSSTGTLTQDAGAQWICRGSSVQTWGFPAPTTAPTVTQTAAPTIYPAWAASTWYAPLFVILASGSLFQLTTAGTTGGSTPSWNTTPGSTTNDGSCQWTCLGPSAWVATHAYTAGTAIQATFTYYITVYQLIGYYWNGYANVPQYGPVQQAVTVTCIFTCTQAGTSGSSTPAWTNGIGTTVTDGTVGWINAGNAPAWPGATQTLSTATKITDTNNNLQSPQVMGKTGSSAPTWNTATGGFTGDNAQNWLNTGTFSQANTGAWIYAYSGKNSITKHVSTASPQSAPIIVQGGNLAVIQGAGLANVQEDEIVLWRTAQGKSTLIYLDTIPNPGANQTWIYTDTTLDTNLNALIAAPTAQSNNPPPAGLTGPVYHLKRIWGFVGNTVYYSGGPDTLVGSGNEAWPPLNFVPFTEQVIKLMPITISNGGILVFTTSHVYVILGTGTSSNPFYPTRYMANVGILGYDAVDVVGSTIYGMTGKSKFFSFDPGAGYTEPGFPIGDQFTLVTTGGISSALYNPATTYVTWHEQSSGDTALYVSDGAVGWFRFSPVASPESGYLWSPRAAITSGTSAVQSVETSSGLCQLLIGPPVGGGPILFRDPTVSTDWSGGQAVAYPSWDVKGNIVLCQSGEVAEIAHVALKSKAVGARPVVSLLLGEISATTATPFDVLSITSTDPPDLPASTTLYSDRYSALQNGVCPKCENFQLKVDYGTQAYPDELLEFSVYGAKHSERKQQ